MGHTHTDLKLDEMQMHKIRGGGQPSGPRSWLSVREKLREVLTSYFYERGGAAELYQSGSRRILRNEISEQRSVKIEKKNER